MLAPISFPGTTLVDYSLMSKFTARCCRLIVQLNQGQFKDTSPYRLTLTDGAESVNFTVFPDSISRFPLFSYEMGEV